MTVELPVPGYACQTLDRLALAALHAGEDEQLDAEYAAAMLQDYYGAAASSGSNGSNATAAAQEAEEGGRRRGQRRRLATAAGGGGDTGDVGGCSLDQKRLGLTLESTFGQAAVTQRRLPAPPPPPPVVVVPPTGFSPFDALSCLSITAVFDGPLAGGTPKGVELYAHCAVPQLSDYGLGTANNGSRFLLRLPALARKEGRDRWARASICTWRRRRRSSARSSGSPRTSPRATRWRSTV